MTTRTCCCCIWCPARSSNLFRTDRSRTSRNICRRGPIGLSSGDSDTRPRIFARRIWWERGSVPCLLNKGILSKMERG
jgi:hypothetical protein